ncbi:MAG: tRNA (cytidine(34)-2'-O)-methyltransferase [Planctomycetota bacterium]|nr:MAG: tRNA (cytidine(34)-2'-O)-methyltransferase [Planctomycetota bacterium]
MPRVNFRVVLHQPAIPNNTGNIGRTCVATGCQLHLIRPLGFDTSVKACRRAGLDYWPRLAPVEHDSWEAFLRARAEAGTGRLWLFSARARRPIWDAEFLPGDWLVFGSETDGLPDEVLQDPSGEALRLPMVAGERSLNVATAVCAVVYEGLRQIRPAL